MFHISGVAPDGRILVAAGRVGVSEPREDILYGERELALDLYDPASDGWQQAPPAPKYQCIRRHREEIWKPGIDEPVGVYEADVPYAWELIVEYPIGGIAGDGRFYWFSILGPVFFDPAKGIWGQGEPVLWDRQKGVHTPPVSAWFRYNPTTVTGPDGRLYVIGGIGYPMPTGTNEKGRLRMLDALEVYDPSTRAWESRASMAQPRQLSAATFGPDGRLYVFGGFGAIGFRRQEENESDEAYARRERQEVRLARASLRSVEVYDPKTDTWAARAPMPAGRESMGAAVGADGRIYVVGGTSQYAMPVPKADVFVYDTETDSWSEGPSLSHPRFHHTVVATPDGRIWAIGGTNETESRRALPRGEREGLVRPIEMLDTKPPRALDGRSRPSGP